MKMRLRMPLLGIAALVFCLHQSLGAQDRAAYIVPGEGPSSAVDCKGRHYRGSDYPGDAIPPWWQDKIKAVAPEYPFTDRRDRHVGVWLFKLTLDLKTGFVLTVRTVRSTGYRTLDSCAAAALRQWRWRPGKWKEIELPIKFTMSQTPQLPGSVRLPNS
jgi:TonB family protein